MTDAMICIDLAGTILDWNKAAEDLLGHASHEIVNRHLSIIYPEQLRYQIPIILDRVAKGLRLSNVNARVVHKNGGAFGVNLSFSPLCKENGEVTRFYLVLRRIEEGKDIHAFLEDAPQEEEGEGKRRTFEKLRLTILACLGSQQMTINQLATYAGINWKTVENHLTYLLGKGLVREVFRSGYVRIFETTPLGREHLVRTKAQGLKAQGQYNNGQYNGQYTDAAEELP